MSVSPFNYLKAAKEIGKTGGGGEQISSNPSRPINNGQNIESGLGPKRPETESANISPATTAALTTGTTTTEGGDGSGAPAPDAMDKLLAAQQKAAIGGAAGQAIAGGIIGLRQINQAKKLRKAPLNVYIPPALQAIERQRSQALAAGVAPGQAMAESQIGRTEANSLRALSQGSRSTADILQGLNRMTDASNSQRQGLSMRNSQFSQQEGERLYAIQAQKSALQQRAAEIRRNAISSLQSSGEQNLINAGVSAIQAGAMIIG